MQVFESVAFVLEHLAALPTSAVSASAALVTGRGVERLVDYRVQPPMEFAAAASGLFVDVDLGSAQDVGVLFLPAGHNLTGTITVSYGPTQGAGTTIATEIVTASVPQLITWTPFSARWWRITMASSGAWQIPELVYGTQLWRPWDGVDPAWEQPLKSSVEVAEFPTFEAVAVLGPGRRRFKLEFPYVTRWDDLAIFEQILEIGRTRPFGLRSSDNRLDPMVWVRLEEDPTVEQVSKVPQTDVAYRIRLELLEQL